MIPKLNGIDHIHVAVRSWDEAEKWYETVLGFQRVEKLMVWAVDGGPLTLEDPQGKVHLALFEADEPPGSTVAFAASGQEFLAWKAHLEGQSIELRITDHDLSWSLYFKDPFGNLYEITTYDHSEVTPQLQ